MSSEPYRLYDLAGITSRLILRVGVVRQIKAMLISANPAHMLRQSSL